MLICNYARLEIIACKNQVSLWPIPLAWAQGPRMKGKILSKKRLSKETQLSTIHQDFWVLDFLAKHKQWWDTLGELMSTHSWEAPSWSHAHFFLAYTSPLGHLPLKPFACRVCTCSKGWSDQLGASCPRSSRRPTWICSRNAQSWKLCAWKPCQRSGGCHRTPWLVSGYISTDWLW